MDSSIRSFSIRPHVLFGACGADLAAPIAEQTHLSSPIDAVNSSCEQTTFLHCNRESSVMSQQGTQTEIDLVSRLSALRFQKTNWRGSNMQMGHKTDER